MMVRLVLEYDGTHFSGWQRQPASRTVEGALREALAALRVDDVEVTAAGRTDAGAHAHGQVVGVRFAQRWEPQRLGEALNAVLPADVSVRDCGPAAEVFHARRDALTRTYRYVVASRRSRSPLLRRFAWQVSDELDTGAMRAALDCLRGTHDFAAFGRSPRPGGGTVRTVSHTALYKLTPLADERAAVHAIEVSANAFLFGMMRSIAGVIVAVGRGRMDSADVVAMLDVAQRRSGVTVAPARGLHQWTVTYPVVAAGTPSEARA
ncbi:MAG: tRNA pseudouridine(38-40) synthase TruA [Candidatus Dormibacteria bacterium]